MCIVGHPNNHHHLIHNPLGWPKITETCIFIHWRGFQNLWQNGSKAPLNTLNWVSNVQNYYFLANHPNTIHPNATPITTRTLMIMMIAPVATHDKLRVWFSTTVSLTPTGRPNPGKMSCVVILMILITARACSLLYPSPSPDREVNKDWDRMIIFAPSDQKYHLSK